MTNTDKFNTFIELVNELVEIGITIEKTDTDLGYVLCTDEDEEDLTDIEININNFLKSVNIIK